MAYSGTQETTIFGDRESGLILKVAINHAGAPPLIEPESVGSLTSLTMETTLSVQGDFVAVPNELDAIQNPERALLDIRLGGLLTAADRPELLRLHEIAQGGKFLNVHFVDALLLPASDDDRVILWKAAAVGFEPELVRVAGRCLPGRRSLTAGFQ